MVGYSVGGLFVGLGWAGRYLTLDECAGKIFLSNSANSVALGGVIRYVGGE